MSHDTPTRPTCPLTRSQVLEQYFLEHRGKLIDIAAFLDRFDRAQPDATTADDFRLDALRRGLALLLETEGCPADRAERLLKLWSDPSTEPIPAAHAKAAVGAYPLNK